jgi:hypothetical protein
MVPSALNGLPVEAGDGPVIGGRLQEGLLQYASGCFRHQYGYARFRPAVRFGIECRPSRTV